MLKFTEKDLGVKIEGNNFNGMDIIATICAAYEMMREKYGVSYKKVSKQVVQILKEREKETAKDGQ